MSVWNEFDDYYYACMNAKRLPELHALFTRYTASQGFENNVLTSISEQRLKGVAWFEFPDPYPEAYIENRWEQVDPVLGLSMMATRPFMWSDVEKHAKLTGVQKRFLSDCADLRVTDGITFPLHGPNGRCEILSLSSHQETDRDSERFCILNAIVTQTWWRFVELSGEALFDADEHIIKLTPKQREVLLWTKDGKTNSDIAEIMGVSVKTVEYHMSRVLDRLSASNRISAVVIALQRGLI